MATEPIMLPRPLPTASDVLAAAHAILLPFLAEHWQVWVAQNWARDLRVGIFTTRSADTITTDMTTADSTSSDQLSVAVAGALRRGLAGFAVLEPDPATGKPRTSRVSPVGDALGVAVVRVGFLPIVRWDGVADEERSSWFARGEANQPTRWQLVDRD